MTALWHRPKRPETARQTISEHDQAIRTLETARKNTMKLSNKTWGKAVLAAAVGLSLLGAPAAAETPQTDSEFDQRVRDALLRNPDIILEVFALLEAKEEAAKTVKDQELIAKVAGELFEGLDPEKPILVEFQDYNCGYCRRAHPVVASLKETMPDLQLVLMETPVLGKESTFTAKAALALKALKGVDAYREFSDAMMSVQGKANAATTIRTLAELGHDPEEIAAAVQEGVGAEDLEKAKRMAEALGATGTPYFVGPGGIIRGAAPADRLQAITNAQGTGETAAN
ncbi:DsbA family protein [Leisingera sp. SS27]|uniref:DsbA family protein n=1 Tax=Leisingera sp. SS27 TaxID=2979462 RepID=UPI00232E0B64|nr:DsbA family protein [Leisingera sp. SS27]MDC0660638.1 DsbA family protein [Leisingera sp. SS27]